MEVELDNGNFWLPSEFLNDVDDDDFKTTGNKGMSILNGFGSYGLNSDLSSPVQSVMGSTETESDEEDYLNELTRKLANSALDDDNKSTHGISDCRLPVNGNRNQVGPQPPRRIPSPNYQFHQIQLKQRQRQYEELVRRSRVNKGGRMVAPPLFVWPTLQQSQQKPPGLRMRVVFLGNLNTKRESTGTGVFLPQQIGAPIETRKKKGCSTVLLPEKVIEALNLNAEAQTRSNGGCFLHNYDAEMRYRNSVMMAEQQRQHVEKDLRLPQEWTY